VVSIEDEFLEPMFPFGKSTPKKIQNKVIQKDINKDSQNEIQEKKDTQKYTVEEIWKVFGDDNPVNSPTIKLKPSPEKIPKYLPITDPTCARLVFFSYFFLFVFFILFIYLFIFDFRFQINC